MSEYVYPALFALFIWWFSTGVIVYLDGLPRRTFRWSMLGATAILGASLSGLAVSSADTSITGAYVAFTCGLLIWGWQEISFYMGYVTGPRKQACPEGCSGWRHFGHGIQTCLYHELAIIVAGAVVVWLTWGQPNQVGMWTFVVLWWMHESAKLNVFLGVRNLNEQFLPDHLQYLRGFLTKKPMNLLFPISVTISTVITAWLVQRALAPDTTAFDAAGYTFLATLMALAVLEHWFLVLPLPAAALWNWWLRSHGKARPFDVEIVTGFLGSGKTTFVRQTLSQADPGKRTVALVNDFGELGVDGSLLRGKGVEVVELPNGCICCSLRKDLTAQLQDVVTTLAPERILIEPSGVANVASLLDVMNGPELRPLIKSLKVFSMIDAGAFLRDYARMPEYFDVQANMEPVFVVNKIDLASAPDLQTIKDTLRALNPSAPVLTATYGAVAQHALDEVQAAEMLPGVAVALEGADGHDHAASRLRNQDALGLTSWSTRLSGQCDPQGLRDVLDAVARGAFGEVDRVKGIAQSGSGWVHFNVAGGRPSVAAFSPGEREEPRVVAIGRAVDGAKLAAAFEACALPAAA